MDWISLFSPNYRVRLLDQLAGRIARTSAGAIRGELQRPLGTMTWAQTRGYILAHASGVIRAEVARVGRQFGFGPAETARLAELARDQVVAQLQSRRATSVRQAA